MKKLALVLAVVAVAALSAPAFSATNPFMDVPMNHWAYDAIGQLAAHGILSGFPDGTYKGQQQTTRYEMASALARALAVVDMTKASKQDVEMLKRLVVEFKDELEALGERVTLLDAPHELDENGNPIVGTGGRVTVLEDRLGGWHIHGTLVFDVMNQSGNGAGDAFGREGDGSMKFDEARLFFERTFSVGITDDEGNDRPAFFRARLRDEAGQKGASNETRFDRFYVEMPFFMDSTLTVGRWNWAWEGDYKISLPETGGWLGDQILTDWTWDGLGITKDFGMGQVNAAVAHPNKWTTKDWMLLARGTFQFTEQIGFDIGGQAFIGDNADYKEFNTNTNRWEGAADNNMWTIYAGLRFDFNDAISFKGIFYHQKTNSEYIGYDTEGNPHWYDLDDKKDANHWAVILHLKQELLKFTSLWLEYGQFDSGFAGMNGGMLFYGSLNQDTFGKGYAATDTKYWRVGLGQQWTEKFATHLFYYGYKVEGWGGLDDVKPAEFGAGLQYQLNDSTTMGLNYIHVKNDVLDGVRGTGLADQDNVVRFRTKVTF